MGIYKRFYIEMKEDRGVEKIKILIQDCTGMKACLIPKEKFNYFIANTNWL